MKLPFVIESFFQKYIKNNDRNPMSAKEKWMIFLLAGLLLAVIIFPIGKKEKYAEVSEKKDVEQSAVSTMNLSQYEMYLSKQLEKILEQIDGAGKVQAWVTISASSEKVFFQESDSEHSLLEEADSVGGTRTEENTSADKSVVRDSGGNPYVVKTLQPKVEGVLVVAEGAGDSNIKKNISEAVEVLFGIDVHRIKVAKKKVEE